MTTVYRVSCPQCRHRIVDLAGPEAMCPECRVFVSALNVFCPGPALLIEEKDCRVEVYTSGFDSMAVRVTHLPSARVVTVSGSTVAALRSTRPPEGTRGACVRAAMSILSDMVAEDMVAEDMVAEERNRRG